MLFEEIKEDEYFKKKFDKNEEQIKVDSNDINIILANRPGMSNRDILVVLSILRRRLGRAAFKSNLKKVVAARTSILDDYFKTENAVFLNKEKEEVTLLLNSIVDINVIISLICEKRGLNENNILVVLGIDGGQGKLIVTITICSTKVVAK